MKKLLTVALAALAFQVSAADKLSVGATAVPHAELLEFVKPELAKQGVELDIKVFTDYVQPNVQVAEKTGLSPSMDAPFQGTYTRDTY